MARTETDRRFTTLVLALSATAWLGLLLVSRSRYQENLGHDRLAEAGPAVFLLLLGGWLLMTVAMMSPAALPFLAGFRNATGRRPDWPLLVALAVGGYFGAWLLVGFGLQTADLVLHRAEHAGLLAGWPDWLIPVGLLAIAGFYQLSPLKALWQDRLVAAPERAVGNWCVHVPTRVAIGVGLRHGGVCAGCCWPLMLPLFALGHGNVVAMAFVSAVMAAETLTSWGRELREPLGIGLLAGSFALIFI
jgi:predicted metal-binding membrane protein